MTVQQHVITDELPASTSLKDGAYRTMDVRRSTRNSLNYSGETQDGMQVEIKEFYLRDLYKRDGARIEARDRKDARMLAGLVRSFARDAAFLTTLDSPAVANVRDVFEENGTAYMISDRPEGVALVERLDQPGAGLTPDEIISVARDLAYALIEIHGFGMLHRDITPANIILTPQKSAILLPDFGTFREDRSKVSRVVSSVLQSTQDYAPFELAFDDKRQGDGSDIYSMAAVIYHLMTGSPPASSLDRLAAVAENEPDPYVKVDGTVEGYNSRFLMVVDFALELFLEARIKSATEFTLISDEVPDLEKAQELQKSATDRSAPLMNRGVLSKLRSLFFRS